MLFLLHEAGITGMWLQLAQHLLLRELCEWLPVRCSKFWIEILMICVINEAEKNVAEKRIHFQILITAATDYF